MALSDGHVRGRMEREGNCKRWHYDVQIVTMERAHYDEEMKGWMQKGGHY